MCQELGVKNNEDIRSSHIMNRRSVTKERLSQWLECVGSMLYTFAAPHMKRAVERVEELTSERLAQQGKIINLQNELIEKKDVELDSIQKTIETGL